MTPDGCYSYSHHLHQHHLWNFVMNCTPSWWLSRICWARQTPWWTELKHSCQARGATCRCSHGRHPPTTCCTPCRCKHMHFWQYDGECASINWCWLATPEQDAECIYEQRRWVPCGQLFGHSVHHSECKVQCPPSSEHTYILRPYKTQFEQSKIV